VRLGGNSIQFSSNGDSGQEKKGPGELESKSKWSGIDSGSGLPMRDCICARVGDSEDIVVEVN
jgi:hypothetical protein